MISKTRVADSHKQVTECLTEGFEALSSGLPLLKSPNASLRSVRLVASPLQLNTTWLTGSCAPQDEGKEHAG